MARSSGLERPIGPFPLPIAPCFGHHGSLCSHAADQSLLSNPLPFHVRLHHRDQPDLGVAIAQAGQNALEVLLAQGNLVQIAPPMSGQDEPAAALFEDRLKVAPPIGILPEQVNYTPQVIITGKSNSHVRIGEHGLAL